jgi:hypothetical protein
MPILDLIMLFVPAALVLWPGRRLCASALLVVVGYVFPLLAILMIGDPGYALPGIAIGVSTANALRAMVHVVAFCVLMIVTIWRNEIWLRNRLVASVGLIAATLMGMSGIAAGGVLAPAAQRAVLVAVVVANVVVLLPSVVRSDRSRFLCSFAKAFMWLAIGVILVAVYARAFYGPYPPWTPRFGRPLNARVLADLLLLALILSRLLLRARVFPLLALAVMGMTGSRLAFVVAIAFLAGETLQRRRLLVGVAGAIGAAGTILALIVISPRVFARSEASAGRIVMWTLAARQLPGNAVWGVGDRFVFHIQAPDGAVQEKRVHNGLLEAALSHGVPFAVMVFAVYGLLMGRLLVRRTMEPIATDRQLVKWLGAAVIIESLFGTAIWTNLGDSFSLSALLVLVVASAPYRPNWPTARRVCIKAT